MVGLTREPIDVAALLTARPQDGAVATFLGVVRATSADGRGVTHLEYEAYEEMAVPEMEAIVGEAAARWDVGDVRLVHRLGRLRVGEASVAIVVTAPHRGPACEACRFVIDSLKERVPIWKKELSADGAAWVEGHAPSERRE